MAKRFQNFLLRTAPKERRTPTAKIIENPIRPSRGLGTPKALACQVFITGPQLITGLMLHGSSTLGFFRSSILSRVKIKEVKIPIRPPTIRM